MKSNKDNLPWTEKYRPTCLSELESNSKIIFTLKNLIENNKFPHLLFYGPPGTGKTSAILACANYLYNNCLESFVIHLNASDERGIDVVRERIKDFCLAGSLFNNNKPKLVILDEADSMTSDAQLALRQIVVNNTKKIRFCLICNYVNKIIPQLQSRFSKFRFNPIEKNGVTNKLRMILDKENIKCDDYSINVLSNNSYGDMRRLINILQSISNKTLDINKDNIYKLLSIIEDDRIDQIIIDLFNLSFEENRINISNLLDDGHSIKDLITKISERILIINISDKSMIYLINKLSNLELNINENSQLSSIVYIVSIFIICRNNEIISK